MPELNDEFAHVSCYNKTTLVSDPGIRDFWGESIDRFWASMYDSTGCLGGAIWAWADEIFMLPDTCVGYGPWGVVDGWRRRKPEFWHVKKAYSPVKITGYNRSKDRNLALTIANRFDHTSLNKVTIYWSEKGANQHWKLPDAMPHKKLLFVLPRPVEDDIVNIYFYLDSLLIDGYSVILKMPDHSVSGMQASVLKLAKTRESTVISNEFINASFSNATGKINHIVFQNDTLLTGGPIPDLGLMNHQKSWESQKTSGIRDIISEGQWKLKTFNVKQEKENVIVSAEGTYDTLRMSYSITFTPDGKMNVKYSLGSITGIAPQAGLRFAVSQKADKVTWRKRGYWSIYPDDHIGRLNGIASIRNPMTEQYRVEPTWGWNYDTKDYFLGGPQVSDSIYKFVNRDYSSRKMNFFLYGVGFTGTTSMFTVRSDGSMSAKMDVMKNSTQYLSVDRFWSYPDLSWGNYEGDKTPSEANGEFSIILNKARR